MFIKKKKEKKIIVLIILTVSFMNIICSNLVVDAIYAENNNLVGHIGVNTNSLKIDNGYDEIVQNSKFVLYCNMNNGAFIVENKSTGYLWKSTIDNPEEYSLHGINEYWSNYVSSPFIVNYTDMEKNEGLTKKAFSITDSYVTSHRTIKNGISFNLEFKEIGIILTIEIILDENGLIIYIPCKEIEEQDKYGLINIEFAPFFGAESIELDGYIFYPDGSGAIMKYKNSKDYSTFIKPYKGFVFSPEKTDILKCTDMEKNQEYNAMLPIFGIKNSTNAFLAIASEGAEETAVCVYPYGYAINLNRANFELCYRHSYEVYLSNITLSGENTAKNLKKVKFDKNILQRDHEIKYILLDGEDANYSGMANVYRTFLIESNGINKIIKNQNIIPLMINLFMGVKEERMLFDKYISMTDFSQAEKIAKEFKVENVENLQVNLIGWSKYGFGLYPDRQQPERRLGGHTKLKELASFTTDNAIKLFLQVNFVDALSSNKTFSKRSDVIKEGNGLAVTESYKERFILKPGVSFEKFNDLLNGIIKKNEIGVFMEKVGKLIYHDYNKDGLSSRADTIRTWENVFNMAISQNIPIGVEGGNAYILKYAEHLFNIPTNSSGYHIADETIPFFQMVVHGMIPYTSTPGNLAYDFTMQKLQWVEYGCVPLFELTYEDTTKLKYTRYNKLFNSQYKNWLNTAVSVYKEFNERLNLTWGVDIVKHENIVSYGIDLFYLPCDIVSGYSI
jgi:hypothetical protein